MHSQRNSASSAWLVTDVKRAGAVVDGRLRATANDGTLHAMLEPLDDHGLAAEAGESGARGWLPDAALLGHIHFRTCARRKVHDFYTQILGLHPRANSAAAKLCEVGTLDRPHMVVSNSWGGEDLPHPPPRSAGVQRHMLEVPAGRHLDSARLRARSAGLPLIDEAETAIAVLDPESNAVRLVSVGP